jgi:hypothetical protein
VLLSKVLQNIANGTTPISHFFSYVLNLHHSLLILLASGTLPGKKEAYMEAMNEFISTHIEATNTFYDKVSVQEVPYYVDLIN